MTIASAAGLVELLRRFHRLQPAALAELERVQETHAEPRALARELVRRGWLTPYQINQLFKGLGASLLLGNYLLLERLGEGGMGAVFKARHRRMERIVALKTLRPERLNNADAVRRFHREIHAAGRLSHPNIVLAFDADEANGVHFFTMEYIEGRDLARLVRQDGPLGVAQACDYIRQAALGLQHAHERGMVHRDIKPHNLLLTPRGVVKILDMGLARLTTQTADGDTTSTGSLTHEGTVMGTPDFMAPEQSLSTRTVDIRADLYALGCTLYFLLAGKPPFPGGTLGDKIARHLAEQPQPIEQRRPDVPPSVAAVLRKLMAKRPEDRYATPAELAAALPRDLHPGTLACTATGNTELDFSNLPEASIVPAPRKLDRRWLAALAGAVLLVMVGVITLIALALRRPAATEMPANAPSAAKGPQPYAILEGHKASVRCVLFTSDGETVASADESGVVKIWRTVRGEQIASRQGHKGAVLALASAVDGTLASGGRDGRIVFWKPATFDQERAIEQAHVGPVRGLYFEGNNPERILASVGDDNTFSMWSPRTGEWVGRRGLPAVPSCTASPLKDSFWFAIGRRDGRTLLWNHEEKDQHELRGHTASVTSVVFTPDGERLVTAGADGCIYLWDVKTGHRRVTLAENLPAIQSVAISANGHLLAAVDEEGNLRLWKLPARTALPAIRFESGELYGVAFSPDGKTLATCGSDRKVHLWKVSELLQPAASR